MSSYTSILRNLREDKDLTQLDVAKIIGTSQQYYSKYETGEHELPIRALVLLANFYGVSTNYILGRTSCLQGIDGLNEKVNAHHTAGKVISDLLSLDTPGCTYVLESIAMQKLKKSSTEEKDNTR